MPDLTETPRRTLPPVPPVTRRPIDAPRPGDSGRHAAVDTSDDETRVHPPVTDLVDSGRHADLTGGVAAAVAREPWTDSWSAGPETGSWSTGSETGRHAAVGPDDADDLSTTGSHRVLVTRPSRSRWVPAGVGAGVLGIVAAVLMTSGFSSGAAAGPATDEAARTEAVPTTAPAPTTTEAPLPTPPMSTIVISPGTPGSGGSQRATSASRTSASSPAPRPASGAQTAAVTPAPSTAETQGTPGGGPPMDTVTEVVPSPGSTSPTTEPVAPTAGPTSEPVGTPPAPTGPPTP
ncbi:hypothetical protein ASG41_08095 [Modestobacter sp. Leaf380]|nr:hypothetical protein ASG41_08095 [Modestobacter sp. Leaf380]